MGSDVRQKWKNPLLVNSSAKSKYQIILMGRDSYEPPAFSKIRLIAVLGTGRSSVNNPKYMLSFFKLGTTAIFAPIKKAFKCLRRI